MCQPTETMKNPKKSYESTKSFRYPHNASTIEDLPELDPSHVPYRIAAKYILGELERHDICVPRVGIM